ncbi:MAG TPA: hypothetical protein VFY29_04600 [Terriglobia bacterium]|nr:hypothetical protein [Terriglobia bacterium]
MKRYFLFLALAPLVLWACNQNANDVREGVTLENAPKPVAENDHPLADAGGGGPEGGGAPPMRDVQKTIAKAFFMHRFVEALYSVPKNPAPNPKWSSPLKDPENGKVWCTDCHDPKKADVSRFPAERTPKVDELEKDHEFMVELMTKWVGRLNSGDFGAKAKLKQPVTCTTCHAQDPRDQ